MAGKYSTSSITFDGVPCYSPDLLEEEAERLGYPIGAWSGKVNSFRAERGRGYGQGWLLMKWGDIEDKIEEWKIRSSTLVFNFGNNGSSNFEGEVSLYSLWFINARAIYADGVNDTSSDTLFLVEIADQRAFFNGTTYTGELSGETWLDLLESLWNKLPGVEVFPTETVPGTLALSCTPSTFNVKSINVWDTFCGLLDVLGLDIFYDPIDAVFKFVNMTAAPLAEDPLFAVDRQNHLLDSTCPESTKRMLPQSVSVVFTSSFPRFVPHDKCFLLSGFSPDDYEKTVDTNIEDADGGKHILFYPVVGETQSEKDAIATEIVANYAMKLQNDVNWLYREFFGFATATGINQQIAEQTWSDIGTGATTEYFGRQVTKQKYVGGHKIIDAAPSSKVRFKLTEDLVVCGTASATIMLERTASSSSSDDNGQDCTCGQFDIGESIKINDRCGIVGASLMAEINGNGEPYIPAGKMGYASKLDDTINEDGNTYEPHAFGEATCEQDSTSDSNASDSDSGPHCLHVEKSVLANVPLAAEGDTMKYVLGRDANDCIKWFAVGLCEDA